LRLRLFRHRCCRRGSHLGGKGLAATGTKACSRLAGSAARRTKTLFYGGLHCLYIPQHSRTADCRCEVGQAPRTARSGTGFLLEPTGSVMRNTAVAANNDVVICRKGRIANRAILSHKLMHDDSPSYFQMAYGFNSKSIVTVMIKVRFNNRSSRAYPYCPECSCTTDHHSPNSSNRSDQY